MSYIRALGYRVLLNLAAQIRLAFTLNAQVRSDWYHTGSHEQKKK